MRTIYYALSIPSEGWRLVYERQILRSVKSIRAHNSDIQIVLCAYGLVPPQLRTDLSAERVEIVELGDYGAALSAIMPIGAATLARYPILHKWLCLPTILKSDPSECLYLDCDTYFFSDVEKLFESCSGLDFCSREEPFSNRSHLGYDPQYLDEDGLHQLARTEHADYIAPLNDGIFLMTGQLASVLASSLPRLCEYVFRFMKWMYENPRTGNSVADESPEAIKICRELNAAGSPPSLPYPSSNRWIRDQLALCLTLGSIQGVRQGFFSRESVLQGAEFANRARGGVLACHYYTPNTARFFDWLDSAPVI